MTFPANFVWGAAAASYQIEGAAREGGKGESVWDLFCRTPGRVWEGHTGDVACDHYHRYREDVALMQQIGLSAYRLSIAWPRVLPEGVGAISPKGLDFYDRLIDALLEAGITPYVTLFHWDYPTALYFRGGWLNPDSSHWFAEYATAVARKLGDRVKHWMTLNEPQVFVGLGHFEGRHAPGLHLRWEEVLRVSHHVLLAHGRAVQALRAVGTSSIGYAPVAVINIPMTDAEEDLEAARQAMFSIDAEHTWNNTWWMDPILLGHYPEDGLRRYGSRMPAFPDRDLDVIASPIDFLGSNIYLGSYTAAGPDGPRVVKYPGSGASPGFPVTGLNWAVTPEALYFGPKFLYERYQKPLLITENGLSLHDWESLDGKVHDPQRIDFTQRYLRELKRAVAEEIPVLGYFHWSILDNFEWAEGYKERFGLIYVDYPTQKRILKDSAHWYAEVVRTGGRNL